MDKIIIKGGIPLKGRVKLSGSKNSALPILAATLLAEGTSNIENLPLLKDIETMLRILDSLGAKIELGKRSVKINTESVRNFTAPYDLVRTMRGSICILGPLLARFGRAVVSLPGGCVIGPRPIDLHLKGLEKLGAKIEMKKGDIKAKAKKLKGKRIFLGGAFGSSVLATANLMMAATLADGETLIEFAACEPEVADLANFLNGMGAKIDGAGSHFLRIKGVRRLKGGTYRIVPDRIEAGTYLVAGLITKGEVAIEGAISRHLGAVIDKIEEAGAKVEIKKENSLHIKNSGGLKSVNVITLPYPGFPTDMQAQFMALMCLAKGTSIITERIFPKRFIHVGELNRMGADISMEGDSAIVKGGRVFIGTRVMASDLRASAALILAALAAKGETEISRVYHLDRGYERLVEKLSTLGAKIKRVE
ncbi:MAG: UDP-N-acetylglucosamine 1-carboxyvinyltransferase [Candidatus Omnitrophica bacterium]|nr:UDP-N-acetylglucosamine 1-carboxyvinyltransferase [Candidatus Omnitrophota bacterium]